MGALPYSIGFMLIISLIAWFSFAKTSQEYTWITKSVSLFRLERELYYDQISRKAKSSYQDFLATADAVEDAEECTVTEEGLENSSQSHQKTEKKFTTSYLHIRDFFSKNQSNKQETVQKIFSNLIRILYKNLPLFPESSDSTEEIIQMIFEAKDALLADTEGQYKNPLVHHLANMAFEGPIGFHKQFVLKSILQGANTEIIAGKRCLIPRLLDYVTTRDFKYCMSVYKAPPALLFALFGDKQTVEEVITYRNDLHKKLIQADSKTEYSLENLSAEFKGLFSSKIPSGIDQNLIDFTVTKGRPLSSIKRCSKIQ